MAPFTASTYLCYLHIQKRHFCSTPLSIPIMFPIFKVITDKHNLTLGSNEIVEYISV